MKYVLIDQITGRAYVIPSLDCLSCSCLTCPLSCGQVEIYESWEPAPYDVALVRMFSNLGLGHSDRIFTF